jgi:hypothetical protein
MCVQPFWFISALLIVGGNLFNATICNFCDQEKKTMEIGMVNNSLQQNLLPFLQCESDCLME